MSDPQTYGDSPNAISSPGSADGHSHYDSPESRRLRAAGRAVRRASHLVWLENKSGSKIPVTWLQPFSTSSQSVVLQCYLGSRLEALLGSTGSILYSWTWKQKVTSAGLLYCQQAVRARSTSETDLFLVQWPTPISFDAGSTRAPRPKTNSGKRDPNLIDSYRYGLEAAPYLILSAPPEWTLSPWPTAAARDHKGGYEGGRMRNGKWSTDTLDVTAQLASWMPPNMTDTSGMQQAKIAAYPTPLTVPDSPASRGQLSGSFRRLMEPCLPDLSVPVRVTASGQVLIGSDAGMGDSGPLNPAHSRWLMGFPPVWDDCAVTAMPSSRKSARTSSAPLSVLLLRLSEAIFNNRVAREHHHGQ